MAKRITFHSGEFAQLVGVNKKTLHYYDAVGVFQPDSVAENGYRCYSAQQLYPFYMLRTLQKLGLSLAQIKAYMETRSPESYAELLCRQQKWLQQEIHRYQRMSRLVDNNIQLLAYSRNLVCDTVTLEHWPAADFVQTALVRGFSFTGRERVISQHVRYCQDKELSAGYPMGAMVAQQDFMTGHESDVSYYITRTDKNLRYVAGLYRRQRPAGCYAVTYLKGDYMETAGAYALLRDYLAQHHLQPGPYSYEEGIVDEMSSADAAHYITRIMVAAQAVLPAGGDSETEGPARSREQEE